MNSWKVMLGQGSKFASQALQGGFIGVDDGVGLDMTPLMEAAEPEFRAAVRDNLQVANPGASKGTISQYATTLWRIAQDIQMDDLVLSPSGVQGQLRLGRVLGGYHYASGEPLPHRRNVEWWPAVIWRKDMSVPLRNSSGSLTTIIDLTGYGPEILGLAGNEIPGGLVAAAPAADPGFQMEKELENFLVTNWGATDLGGHYDLYRDEDGDVIGQQYQTATGPIDILAVKKDGTELLVVELKRGAATDRTVGQIQRYMGYVKQEVAEPGQKVRGLIIALEDDVKLQYALAVAPDISFYTYRVSFELNHTGGLTL